MAAHLQDILNDATRRLEEAGVAGARFDASLLLAYALGLPRDKVILSSDKLLDNNEISSFQALIERRRQHEPIAYITGEKEFWSLDFSVTRDTLIPRPDSETLIEAVLKRVHHGDTRKQPQDRAKPIALLDIGTGTGCLLITLLKEISEARGIGVDNSERALQVAQENAKRHGVEARAEFMKSHWCDAIHGTFDLILSNPPYIAEGASLMPDVVHFEPHAALFAGADGLDAYRTLAPQVATRLSPGGYVFFEVGQGQASDVAQLLEAEGLTEIVLEKDLAGIERCVVARNVVRRPHL